MSKIEIHKNSITHLNTDAVVNAANSGLAEGGGVCGAIFKAAGSVKLAKECEKYGHCKTGDAVITPACDMKNAKYIIHAVGPIYAGGTKGESDQLYSCYKKSLQLAKDYNCASIGFPLISAGIFGYPHAEAWEIALTACRDFVNDNPDYNLSIVFVSTDRETVELGKSVLAQISAKEIPDCRILTKYLDVAHNRPSQEVLQLFILDVSYFVMTCTVVDLRQYNHILAKHGVNTADIASNSVDVDNLDAEAVLAMIVYAYRNDYWCNGALYEYFSNGAIGRWLKRLSQLNYTE